MVLPQGASLGIALPFCGAFVLTLVFAYFYIRRYRNPYDRDVSSFATSVACLVIVLVTSALLPVDIFIVSIMKNSDGSFKEWAQNITVRNSIEDGVLYAYYSLYALVFLCVFVFVPFMYFYYEEKDEDGFGSENRCCSAFKFTAIFVVVAGIFLMLGAFLPLRDPPPANATNFEKIKFLVEDLGKDRGEDALMMALNILTAIGMICVVFYTGFGLTSWPVGLIRGTRSVRNQFEEIQNENLVNQTRINMLRDKERQGGRLTARERRNLARFEEDQRRINREEHLVDQHQRTWIYKLRKIIRPVEIILGIAVAAVSLLVLVSLILNNVDKVMHSLGPKMGYMLPKPVLPNPLDMLLVQMQKVFPLDYIMIIIITWMLVLCTISGVRNLGLWIFFYRMYKLRIKRTRPQGLLIMCVTLMFTVLALNVIVYSTLPQYASYGSQHYISYSNATNSSDLYSSEFNVTCTLEPCSNKVGPDYCTMTRSSALLNRFFYKAWIFGAVYYWLTWGFIGISLIAFIYVIVRGSRSITDGLVEDDDFEESDEDLLRP